MMKAEKNNNARRDDAKLIEELCLNTWEPVYRFVYFKVQNREEAEDITQEAYYKSISYIQKNSIGIEKAIGFLKTVSLNILRDKWRQNKRRGTSVNLDDISPEKAAIEDPTEGIAQREVIREALKLLSEDQRTVIELRILKGFSVADTAKRMNRKESSVRVIQFRGLQNLTKILKDDFQVGEGKNNG